jgi:protein SCO1
MRVHFLLLAATLLAWVPARAHDDAKHAVASSHSAATTSDAPVTRAARLFFGDRRLVTQDGREVAFYSDVLKDRVVLVSFVFTHCTDSCPTQTAKMAAVQALVGASGTALRFVSISVDPEHDTPAALAAYAANFGAGPNWMFLTGRKEDVDDVLRRLGQSTAVPASHATLFIAGNAATGHWLRVHPDASPEFIAGQLHALAAESAQRIR